jgi:hypothetical protein
MKYSKVNYIFDGILSLNTSGCIFLKLRILRNLVQMYCVHMYENGKMRPVETIPGVGGGRIKENGGGVNSTMMCCEHFCKCHSASPAQQ